MMDTCRSQISLVVARHAHTLAQLRTRTGAVAAWRPGGAAAATAWSPAWNVAPLFQRQRQLGRSSRALHTTTPRTGHRALTSASTLLHRTRCMIFPRQPWDRPLHTSGSGTASGVPLSTVRPRPQFYMLRVALRWVVGGLVVFVLMPQAAAEFVFREPVAVTGRDRPMLVSARNEVLLGKSMVEQLLQTGANVLPPGDARVIAVTALASAINDAALEVIHPSLRPYWELKVLVVDEPVRNAFCAPGGVVVVYTGLLEFIEAMAKEGQVTREGALATVLAHEIGHAVGRHSAETISLLPGRLLFFALAAPVLWIALPLLVDLPHRREMEGEADIIGLVLMEHACMDLGQAVAFYRASPTRMASERGKAGIQCQWLASHPSDESRAAVATALATVLAQKQRQRHCPLPLIGSGDTHLDGAEAGAKKIRGFPF